MLLKYMGDVLDLYGLSFTGLAKFMLFDPNNCNDIRYLLCS